MLREEKNTPLLNILQEYSQTPQLPENSVLGAEGGQDVWLKYNL